ncbi:bZIP transcription factor [Trichophyton rubrum]|uniref:BZIP transcription factor n=1 Tax=Trichophyton rubrum TaxID=5551 RepID=A0A178F5T5_TRIRU|nr:bZIP transcription factor [Trichophyton rubrum]
MSGLRLSTSIKHQSTLALQSHNAKPAVRPNGGTRTQRENAENTAEDAYVSKSRVGDQRSGFVILVPARLGSRRRTSPTGSGICRKRFCVSFPLFPEPASQQQPIDNQPTRRRTVSSIEKRACASSIVRRQIPESTCWHGLRPPDADPDRHRKRLTQQHRLSRLGVPG